MKRATIRKDGNYSMFQTTMGNSVICLDNEEWFTKQQNYLMKTAPHHQKSIELISGKYLLIGTNDNVDHETLHLYLLKTNDFEELILEPEFCN